MILEHPAPPLSIPLETLPEIVSSVLRKKRWHHFEMGTVKLKYTPVWLFAYEAFFEREGVAESEITGRTAINACTGEKMDQVPFILEEMPLELSKETKHEYKCVVEEPMLSREEAAEIARIKISSQLGVKKENVHVAGGKLIYYPIWDVWIKVREGEYKLSIDGVAGTVFGEEKVPEHEPGWYEITQEVLNELKNPKYWLEYLKTMPRWAFWIAIFILAFIIIEVVL